jgi:PilZ domain-containing protein
MVEQPRRTRIPDSRTGDRRNETRVALSLRGFLTCAGEQSRCLIHDMSAQGFFIVSTKSFLPRQTIELSCEPYPSHIVNCTIEVKHVDDAGIGTMIVAIDEKSKVTCARILEEHYSSMLDSLDSHSSR